MISIYDVTNKLRVIFKTVLDGVVLATFTNEFSEVVPNVEQANITEALLGFANDLAAKFGPTAIPGGIFDPRAVAEITFQVLAADDQVLETFEASFNPSVSNEEQTIILHQLGKFASELSGENAPA